MNVTLFEISWEVCNKVGGIHTVIRSKLPLLAGKYARYLLLGPERGEGQHEFEEQPVPGDLRELFARISRRGVGCRYGRWLAPSTPEVVLLDFSGLYARCNDLKAGLWERHGIDSLNSAWEFDEPLCFGTAAGIFAEEYAKGYDGKTILHAHEWLSGFSILHLKSVGAGVGTIFTTHATILGRSLAARGEPLYEMLDEMNPDERAYGVNVQDKHLTEKACAHTADVFTTVSEITGLEAERILGRKPDVLLYNGFASARFPTFEETAIKHYESKRELEEFIAYHFFPYQVFDMDKTFIFFTSGRYEFSNKGMDVLIDSLAELNRRLAQRGDDCTIICFFWVIMGRGSPKREVLENKNFYSHIKTYVEWQERPLMERVVFDIISGHKPGKDDFFTTEFLHHLHEDVRQFKRSGLPPMATHDIPDEEHDPILSKLRDVGLMNGEEDRVKVVLYPGYLDGTDGLLNMQYYDAIIGSSLGIFPSHYEPWGYTPLESAALGVPAITTDLAGFGRYVSKHPDGEGVTVINRHKKGYDEVTAQLVDEMEAFTKTTKDARVRKGFAAKQLAASCDWKIFIDGYFKAHAIALEKAG